MNQLSIFVDTSTDTEAIRRQLAGVFELRFRPLDRIQDMTPEPYLVFDINMHDGPHLIEIKEWLKRRPKDGKVVFVIDETSRSEKIQARALGATDVIHRPIDGKALLTLLWGDFDSLAVDTSDPPLKSNPAVGPAFDALENVFSSACLGAPLDIQKLHSAGEVLIDCIEFTRPRLVDQHGSQASQPHLSAFACGDRRCHSVRPPSRLFQEGLSASVICGNAA